MKYAGCTDNSVSVYGYVEEDFQKKCMLQSRKVLWVVLRSLKFFKEIWTNGTRGHRHMFVSAKGKQQKEDQQLQCIDHIPYYLSG